MIKIKEARHLELLKCYYNAQMDVFIFHCAGKKITIQYATPEQIAGIFKKAKVKDDGHGEDHPRSVREKTYAEMVEAVMNGTDSENYLWSTHVDFFFEECEKLRQSRIGQHTGIKESFYKDDYADLLKEAYSNLTNAEYLQQIGNIKFYNPFVGKIEDAFLASVLLELYNLYWRKMSYPSLFSPSTFARVFAKKYNLSLKVCEDYFYKMWDHLRVKDKVLLNSITAMAGKYIKESAIPLLENDGINSLMRELREKQQITEALEIPRTCAKAVNYWNSFSIKNKQELQIAIDKLEDENEHNGVIYVMAKFLRDQKLMQIIIYMYAIHISLLYMPNELYTYRYKLNVELWKKIGF